MTFAAFILSHDRPKVTTHTTRRRQGYTGRVIVLVDDADPSLDKYRDRYEQSDDVDLVIFSKEEIAPDVDAGDNFGKRGSPLFARWACFKIAKAQCLTHFVQLDDDYTSFLHKQDGRLQYRERPMKNLDAVFEVLLGFLDATPTTTVAMSQNGDFIGGPASGYATDLRLRRKAMNSFFCRTDRPFKFLGILNDDVSCYVVRGGRGELFFTVPQVGLIQRSTQSAEGGITDLYLETGTYVKSFYSVMMAPSCVSVAEMGAKHKRLHHMVTWRCAVPKILRAEWRAAQ